jgi:hypothetical protein
MPFTQRKFRQRLVDLTIILDEYKMPLLHNQAIVDACLDFRRQVITNEVVCMDGLLN